MDSAADVAVDTTKVGMPVPCVGEEGDGETGKRSILCVMLSYFCPDALLCQNSRVRESSVAIDPNWKMLEEIDFVRLAKLRLDVDEPDTMCFSRPLVSLSSAYNEIVIHMAVCSLGTRPTTA